METKIDDFKAFLKSQASITDADFDLMAPHIELLSFRKKEVLFDSGKICRHLYWVHSGLLRIYTLDDDKVTTLSFVEDTHFYTDFESILTQEPCIHAVDCLEPTQVLRMPYEKLLAAYDHSHRVERLGRLMVERAFTNYIRLESSINKNTPLANYEEFETANPQLIQRIPLKVMASFLRITPESLSRLRKKRVLG